MALGVVLRVVRWWDGRSLWRDEAALAVAFLDRSYRGLLEPLDFDVTAGVGFLWLTELAFETLGRDDRALRVWPLLAGLVMLPLFAGVLRRLVSPAAGLVALALLAGLEPLVYYASELKAYAIDAAAAVAVLWAALRAREPGAAGGRLVTLGAIGLVSLALSQPAVFVCAGVAAVGLLERARAGDRRRLLELAAVGALWGVLFLANWWLFLSQARPGSLVFHWSPGYLPFPPRSGADLAWAPRMAASYFRDPGGIALPWLALAASAVGAVGLARRAPWALALVLAPVGLLVLASALQLYPILTSPAGAYPWIGRLVLFTVPGALLLVAAGLDVLLHAGAPALRVLAALVALALVGPAALEAGRKLVHPPRLQEMREVVRTLAEHAEPDDTLLVYAAARPAMRYYADRAGLPLDPRVRWIPQNAGAPALHAFLARHARGRTWLVFAHHPFWPSRQNERIVVPWLEARAKRSLVVRQPGASARLYLAPDDSAGSPAPAPGTPAGGVSR